MTLQRMARENSEATRKASQDFFRFVKSLTLAEKWNTYTWNGNMFEAVLVNGKPQIKYKEYRTENEYGLYTFDKNGKLHYSDESHKNFNNNLEVIETILLGIILLAIFIACPITGFFFAQLHYSFIAMLLIGIPSVLWCIGEMAGFWEDYVFPKIIGAMLISIIVVSMFCYCFSINQIMYNLLTKLFIS